jgi:hypothetical protein
MAELFQRSLNAEPADEYARRLHARFQIPGDPQATVDALKGFGTPCLRKLHAQVAPYIGPPTPDWMYDLLGHLVVTARDIREKEQPEFLKEIQRREKQKQAKERAEQEEKDRAAEEREYEEHPERFVDGALRGLGMAFKLGAGAKRSGDFLRRLLVALSRQMKGAFLGEVKRLRDNIRAMAEDTRIRERLDRFLEAFVEGWKVEEEVT